MKTNKRKPSYNKGRICQHCQEPIADHEHQSRIFCEVALNPDGSVRDCKTDFHTRKNSEQKKADRAIINDWKEMYYRAQQMVAKKGATVTTQDLHAYDILLIAPIGQKMHSDFSMMTYFRGFQILTNPFTDTHFITINTYKNE
jgi:hypothetical protein